MCIVSFKERVKNEAIANAGLYEANFINFEYLICSEAFDDLYHIIKSDKGNYLHLIGIHTNLTAEDFFDKCYDGQLKEEDFDFIKPNKSEKSVKGSVREKVNVLPYMVRLFEQKLYAEDNFKKNKIECAFATAKEVDLIFKKVRSSEMPYSELIYGNVADIMKYKEKIADLISEDFLD